MNAKRRKAEPKKPTFEYVPHHPEEPNKEAFVKAYDVYVKAVLREHGKRGGAKKKRAAGE
jgi:hypothetical protein